MKVDVDVNGILKLETGKFCSERRLFVHKIASFQAPR